MKNEKCSETYSIDLHTEKKKHIKQNALTKMHFHENLACKLYYLSATRKYVRDEHIYAVCDGSTSLCVDVLLPVLPVVTW